MIERIVIENFKSLKNVDLKLGRLNLFIGTNASGKSNFFDALRVIQGIGYGFTFHEILDGKPKSATSEVWEGIRGGSGFATFREPDSPERRRVPNLKFRVELASEGDSPRTTFDIAINAQRGCVREERLFAEGDVYTSSPERGPISNHIDSPFLEVRYYRGSGGRQPQPQFEKSRAILHQIARSYETADEHRDVMRTVARKLSNMQRVDPLPSVLRGYSMAHEIARMGEHGENFAALIKSITDDHAIGEAYVAWLRELRPAEVDKVLTLPGAVQEPMFALQEIGRSIPFPAPVLSDGTLRFAAITAAFFQPDMPEVLTIEEIENGIHPGRMRLLLELLRSRAGQAGTQVMATSHSPWLLDWLSEEEWKTTFFCHRDPETGASTISPLTAIPGFQEAAQKGRVGELLAEGWMDFAL
jgi:predicted ATPase